MTSVAALVCGGGGSCGAICLVAHATGIARSTINRGVNDLEAFESARKVQRADG
jgi:hypothetical protein